MISKDKITEIFCIADDFCKELEKEFAKKVLPDSDNAPKRHRKRMMSDAEVITILICFHFNSYRNFKHYYLYCVRTVWKDLFPKTFSYNRFIEVMPRCFVAMTMFLKLAVFGKRTGILPIRSTESTKSIRVSLSSKFNCLSRFIICIIFSKYVRLSFSS